MKDNWALRFGIWINTSFTIRPWQLFVRSRRTGPPHPGPGATTLPSCSPLSGGSKALDQRL